MHTKGRSTISYKQLTKELRGNSGGSKGEVKNAVWPNEVI